MPVQPLEGNDANGVASTCMVVVAVLGAAVAFGFWGFSHDDAFITYRYADNLARGNGLVFNPGEPALGTTAPGWAAVLGVLAAVGGPVGVGAPEWGTLLSVGAIVLIAGCVGAGARGGGTPGWQRGCSGSWP